MTYKQVRTTIRNQAELLFHPNGEWFWVSKALFLKRPLHFHNAPPKTRRQNGRFCFRQTKEIRGGPGGGERETGIERGLEAERSRGMTEDEGGETGERKQTATVVEKGQGAGAKEEIKNRGEGVESYALSWRPRGAAASSLTQMIKRCY